MSYLATVEGEEWPVDVVEEPIAEIVEEQIEAVSEEVTANGVTPREERPDRSSS